MDPIHFSDDFIYKTGERIIPGSVSLAALSEHYTRYFFAQKICKGKKVLNVACGAGYGSEVLEKTASEVFNVDISEQLVAYGNLKYGNHKNHFLTMDAQKMSFPDSFFDVIVSFETFEHLPQYQNFLEECRRVLKKDGRLILSMPNKNITSPGLDKPLNPFHFKEWTVKEFVEVIKRRFKAEVFYGQNLIRPNYYSPLSPVVIFRGIIGFLYQKTPALIFKILKKHYFKFRELPLEKIKLLKKDQIRKADFLDFEINKKQLSYAIILVILKKVNL